MFMFNCIGDNEWFYLLPQIAFHIVGTRSGLGRIFPKKWKGIQIHFTWLIFDVFYSSVSEEDFYGDTNPYEW